MSSLAIRTGYFASCWHQFSSIENVFLTINWILHFKENTLHEVLTYTKKGYMRTRSPVPFFCVCVFIYLHTWMHTFVLCSHLNIFRENNYARPAVARECVNILCAHVRSWFARTCNCLVKVKFVKRL